MEIKIKALWACALAVLLSGSLVAGNAAAETGGHFTTDIVVGTLESLETEQDAIQYDVSSLGAIECKQAAMAKKIANMKTFTTLLFNRTEEAKCKTSGESTYGETTIDFHECGLELKIGKNAVADNTVDLTCAGEEEEIEITHPNCRVQIPQKQGLSGASYKTAEEGGKHIITVELTVSEVEANFEYGFCILLGTSQSLTITGSFIARVFEEGGGGLANLTATGSEDEE